jgi:SH3 domain-containing protein
MTLRATLSPAWLGIFAALSFGGLVIASFASGYHLVMKTPPRGASAASEDNPAASAAAEPSAAAGGDVPNAPAANDTAAAANGGRGGGSTTGAAGPATAGTASDPAEAIVRTNLPPNRAVVRSRPETGGIVARLPSNQRVAVRGRQGQWVRVEFERKGKHVLGWTLESNLQLR